MQILALHGYLGMFPGPVWLIRQQNTPRSKSMSSLMPIQHDLARTIPHVSYNVFQQAVTIREACHFWKQKGNAAAPSQLQLG